MIDNKDSEKVLNALAKRLGVIELGAHSYDGVGLFCCGLDQGGRPDRVVELQRAERLWPDDGCHDIDWYEIPLLFPPDCSSRREMLSKLEASGRGVFKHWQFLSLDSIAKHLKMLPLDVKAAAARALLKQALGRGVYVARHGSLDVFKIEAPEEIFVLADLLACKQTRQPKMLRLHDAAVVQ